ncbi:alpha/beta hydrolase, partial [Aeromonas veronii]|uniref:alpha/beta hydrolase n=1 Tax=Aeromonas veronii TaxID=654 RepID=UPI0038B4377F
MFHVFSLKTQVFLGPRTYVTILLLGHKRDFICPEQDVRALASASRNGKAIVFDNQPLMDVFVKAIE